MKNSTKLILAFSCSMPLQVNSQETAPEAAKDTQRVYEEIYVTSDKLGSASQQEMPVSVQQISGDDLVERGAFEFVDFAGSIPSMQFQDLGPGDKEYIIRGINSSGPSTVGVYFDETPITGSNAQDGGGRNVDIKLVDLQTAEVFNGPQGTQYGANSMSGLIRYVPNKPNTYEFEAVADVDVSSTDDGGENGNYNAVLNVPISEGKAAVRLVGWGTEADGWVDQHRAIGGVNGVKENINSESTVGGRIMFRWMPTDRWMIDSYYLQQAMDVDGSSRYVPKGTEYFGASEVPFPASWTPGITQDDYQNADFGESPWSETLKLFSTTASYEFDSGRVTGSFSKYTRDIDFSFDATPLAILYGLPITWGIRQPQERDTSFAELRYSSDWDGDIQLLVGGSYRTEVNDWQSQGLTYNDEGLLNPFAPGPANSAFVGGDVVYQRYIDFELKQQALFSEVSYEATDELVLAVGARYFASKQEAKEGSVHPEVDGPFPNDDGDGDSKVTGKLSATYSLSADRSVYGLISQGFRVGGLNNSDSLADSGIPKDYDPDILTNYEIGYKSKVFDEAGVLNLSIYHIDWEDMQVETTTGSVPWIDNAGNARVRGLEMSFNTYIGSHYSMELAASYADTELMTPDNNEGAQVPNVPKAQGYAALKYDTAVGWGDLSVRGDMTYRGAANIQISEADTFNYELDSYAMLGLRASLTTNSDWVVTLYAKNLNNVKAQYDAINSDQDPLAVVGARPRTIGLRIRKEFN